MDEMMALRCKYCGAPLDENAVKDDSPYVTCTSCGTTQQKLDAREYLNQLMGQVRSWVNSAMPGGMSSFAGNQNVDSVARHNIFMTNFKPRIDMEFTKYKFGFNNLLSQVMMILPFTEDKNIKSNDTSNSVFEFGAKMKEISPLAVSDESTSIMTEVSGVTDAYALLINNTELIQNDKPGRYTLMASNFTIASQDFAKIKGYEPAQKRFEGLATLCQGCEKLTNGDIASSFGLFSKGKSLLEEASKEITGNLKVAVMSQAVAQEIKQADVLIELAEYVNNMGGSKEVFDAVRRIFTYQFPATGNWSFLLKNRDRFSEIFTSMSAAVKARSGSGTIPVAAGSGNILVPFWYVKLKYSFQTGSLWKKHSVEVEEPLLVPADFVIDGECLSNPRTAVTDVFSVKGNNGMFAGLTGNETSISNSQGIGRLIQSASQSSADGREVVVPLSTKREAERISESYVQAVSRVESKLKLSNPDVIDLIYVPFTKSNDRYQPNDSFGILLPRRVANTYMSELIII